MNEVEDSGQWVSREQSVAVESLGKDFGGLFVWPSEMPEMMAGPGIEMKNLKQGSNLPMNMMEWLENNSDEGWVEDIQWLHLQSKREFYNIWGSCPWK